jgi:hypothetical protein
MTEANPFRVPLSALAAVHVDQADQVEAHGEPSLPEPWSGRLTTAPDGGGAGDADGE